MKYRPEIDGLRAIAILLVLFYHARIPAFSGGFVGVDVFFVISGYLITSIVYHDITAGRFFFGAFYLRRVRRLFPALFLVCFAVAIACVVLFTPRYLSDFGLHLASTVFYVSNLFLWQQSTDYFSNVSEFWPLLHSWSLAIEEQYYIFWPMLLLLLVRHGSMRRCTVAVVLLLLGSFAAFYWGFTHGHALAAFYLLPTRAWELLLGCILALPVLPIHARKVFLNVLSLLGLSLIGFACVFLYLTGADNQTLGMAAACLGAALIIYSSTGQSTYASSLLSCRLLVSIGLISYSLYLWHWPVLSLTRYYLIGAMPWYAVVLALQGTIILSYLSWKYVEQPFRKNRHGIYSDKNVIALAVLISVLLAGAGLFLWHKDGLFGKESEFLRLLTTTRQQVNPLQATCNVSTDDAELPPSKPCLAGAPGKGKNYEIILWGDSHANHYAPAIARLAKESGMRVRQLTKYGCPPLLESGSPDCRAFNEAVMKVIRKTGTIKMVVLAGAWHTGAANAYPITPQEMERSLTGTAEFLERNNLTTLILGQIPMFDTEQDIEICLEYILRREDDSKCLAKEKAKQSLAVSDALLHRLSQEHRSVYAYFPLSSFCKDAICAVYDAKGFFYHDGAHLTLHGAETALPGLRKVWEKIPWDKYPDPAE